MGSTRKMIAIAFPGFPNNDTKVYTIEINTSDENTDIAVLQIAGGGGTFPIQVTPEFFQVIHPYLPFSYSIEINKNPIPNNESITNFLVKISGTGPPTASLKASIELLSLFGIGFLLIGVIFKPITDPLMRKATEKAEESDVME
jgi:putative membrane protein